MRKYFLLSAVALMATTNANASDTRYTGTLEVTGNVEYAATFTCTELKLGTITFDFNKIHDNNIESTNLSVTGSGTASQGNSGEVISVQGYTAANCDAPGNPDFSGSVLDGYAIELQDVNGVKVGEIWLDGTTSSDGKFTIDAREVRIDHENMRKDWYSDVSGTVTISETL
ncbi:MAG: hypothetical protein IJ019_01560 [Alphaproteobacteria bacterium]|nr:hypothetical protein [Alphaproteobacteria bacterium]